MDVQADFLPGGSLGIPGGLDIINPIVDLILPDRLVVATRDWHPPDHCSFKENGGTWPTHCVRGTPGAAINPLVEKLVSVVLSKGINLDIEEYSGFENPALNLILQGLLAPNSPLYIVGLALDYCVRATTLHALAAGFDNVIVPLNCTKAVGDPESTLLELEKAGARFG